MLEKWAMNQNAEKIRLDKWLWVARFFKTRAMATEAIDGGHVHLNGDRVKPARALKQGDMLRIYTQHGDFEVMVRILTDKRGPAEVARTLFEETPESLEKRARIAEEKALAPQFDHPDIKGRPSKKWRRQLNGFERRNG